MLTVNWPSSLGSAASGLFATIETVAVSSLVMVPIPVSVRLVGPPSAASCRPVPTKR